VHVTGRAVAWLVTCPDPTVFTGRVVVARDLVQEHFLLQPAELASPWVRGRAYHPYEESVWRRLRRERGA
jgi:hypothetical protein